MVTIKQTEIETEAIEAELGYISVFSIVKTTEGGQNVFSVLNILYENGEYAGHDFIYDAARDESEANTICSRLSKFGVTPATARYIIEDIIAQT